MDWSARLGLIARALVTTIIHGSVMLGFGICVVGVSAVIGFVLSTVLIAPLLSLVLEPFVPEAVSLGTWKIGIVAIALFGPYRAARVVRSWVHEGREELLEGVEPVEIEGAGQLATGARLLAEFGADETRTDSEIRERVRELFATADADTGGVSDDPGRTDTPAGEQRRLLVETTRRLAAQAGVACPTLGIHPSESPLCYTVHHEDHVFLVVSHGLLLTLPAEELEAVLAHEIAHLANGDHRFMTWATVPLMIVDRNPADPRAKEDDQGWLDIDETDRRLTKGFAAVYAILLGFVASYPVLDSILVDHPLMLKIVLFFVFVAAVPLVVLTLLVIFGAGFSVLAVLLVAASVLVRFWAEFGTGVFSRGRELAADSAAARLTGDPGALGAALQRLNGSLCNPPQGDLRDLVHTVDALNVVPALDPDRDGSGGLLATHPGTETRVERLRELEREQETA